MKWDESESIAAISEEQAAYSEDMLSSITEQNNSINTIFELMKGVQHSGKELKKAVGWKINKTQAYYKNYLNRHNDERDTVFMVSLLCIFNKDNKFSKKVAQTTCFFGL